MDKKDIEIIVTKGSGPGGQHRNKVETCVTVIHKPTGLQIKCQETRSKIKNIEIAKKKLEEKIKTHQDRQAQEAKNEKRKELIKNQKVIRTYNYTKNEVHDHRTKVKHDLKKFMKGDIDESKH